MSAEGPIASLIQARLSSSRLPGKSLLPLGGRTVLDHVIERAAAFSEQVVVCTSTDPSDDRIARHCEARGVLCVRGSLDDVFARFRLALADPRVLRTSWFARVTADCPLLSVPLARASLAARAPDLDYVALDHATLPRGLAIELVRRSAFEAIDAATLDGPEREHVTPRLYEQPGRYRCRRLRAPAGLGWPDLRLTLDYPEDYALLERLFEEGDDLTAERAVRRLIGDPELRALNAGCEQRCVRPAGGASAAGGGLRP
jgi:spore coat polysaccharide biosynthesis protein SpsF (cytidylyltransferase family)